MPKTKVQDDHPEGVKKAIQELLDFKLPEGVMEQAVKQIWDDAWNGELGSTDEQSLLAGADFVDRFDHMLESQNPPPQRNEGWIAEARAATSHIWEQAAKELAEDLLEEGRRAGYFAPEPEDNLNLSQPNQD